MSFRKIIYRVFKRALEPLGISVKLEPRATIKMKVYRAATNKWETIKVRNVKVSQDTVDKLKQELKEVKSD
jgi:hypothetical protein